MPATAVTEAGPGSLRGTADVRVGAGLDGAPLAPARSWAEAYGGSHDRAGTASGVTSRPASILTTVRSPSSSMPRRRRPRSSAPSFPRGQRPDLRPTSSRGGTLMNEGAEDRGRRRLPLRGPAGPGRSPFKKCLSPFNPVEQMQGRAVAGTRWTLHGDQRQGSVRLFNRNFQKEQTSGRWLRRRASSACRPCRLGAQ